MLLEHATDIKIISEIFFFTLSLWNRACILRLSSSQFVLAQFGHHIGWCELYILMFNCLMEIYVGDFIDPLKPKSISLTVFSCLVNLVQLTKPEI